MGKAKVAESSVPKRKMKPALTPEGEENQMISLAVNLAKKQLIEGTASSQVISHYLKLGSTKAQLENEKLKKENELLKAKTESIQSSQRNSEMYEKALEAFRNYSGHGESYDY